VSLQNEIRAFFDEYEARWNSKRFAALGELWDHDDSMPFYRPMEVDGYITQWTDLERYWEPRPGTSFIDELNFRYTNLHAKLVSPDVAVVMSDFEWDLKMKGGEYAKPLSGRDPVITVLKKKPEGWRMCAYVEACMHPAIYVKKLCDMTVRPSFVTTLREAGKVKSAPGTGDAGDFGKRRRFWRFRCESCSLQAQPRSSCSARAARRPPSSTLPPGPAVSSSSVAGSVAHT